MLNLHLPVHLLCTLPKVWQIVTRMGNPYCLLPAAPNDLTLNSILILILIVQISEGQWQHVNL